MTDELYWKKNFAYQLQGAGINMKPVCLVSKTDILQKPGAGICIQTEETFDLMLLDNDLVDVHELTFEVTACIGEEGHPEDFVALGIQLLHTFEPNLYVDESQHANNRQIDFSIYLKPEQARAWAVDILRKLDDG